MEQVNRKQRSDKGKLIDTAKIKLRIPSEKRKLLEVFPEYKGLDKHPIGTIVRLKNYRLAKLFETNRDIIDKNTGKITGQKKVRKLVFISSQNLPDIIEDMIKQNYLNVEWPNLDDPDFREKIQDIFISVGIVPNVLSKKIDPNACFQNINELKLNYYQRMIGFYVAYSPDAYRGLLVWHGLGSGKSCSSIDIIDKYIDRKLRERDLEESGGRYNIYSNSNRDLTKPKGIPKIYIVTPPVAQLEENFRGELRRCPSIIKEAVRIRQTQLALKKLDKQVKLKDIKEKVAEGKKVLPKIVIDKINASESKKSEEIRVLNDTELAEMAVKESRESSRIINTIINRYVTFLSYIKLSNRLKLPAGHKEKVNLENSLIIMDEAHNILNPEPREKKKYLNVIKNIRATKSIKICLLTATPIFSKMSDLTRLINILKKDTDTTLPENEKEFMIKYFDSGKGNKGSKGNKGIDKGAKKNKGIGEDFEDAIEDSIEGEDNSLKIKSNIFKSDIKGLISFFNDPDPNFFASLDRMAKQISIVNKEHEEKWNQSFKNEIKSYGNFDFSKSNIRETHKFFNPKRGYFVQSSKITNIPNTFLKDKNWPEKFEDLLQNILKYPQQKHFIISRHKANGANAIGRFLEEKGWFRISDNRQDHGTHPPKFSGDLTAQKIASLLKTNRNTDTDSVNKFNLKKKDILTDFGGIPGKSFAVLNDLSLVREINKIREFYNIPENMHGKYIKVLIVDRKFSEGMSLMNVQNVHIFDPFYSKQGEEQAIARARRFCSHKEQPFKERRIKIWKYFARGHLKENGERKGLTDDILEEYAYNQQKILQQIIEVSSESSIDTNYLERVKTSKQSKNKLRKLINYLLAIF